MIPEKRTLLNLAEICPGTYTLGPGLRFAIWVQGCPFNCKGCVSQDWIPFKLAQVFAVEELAEMIVSSSSLDGITISGGEPFMQAGKIVQLLQLIETKAPHLNTIVFTGFNLEQLTWTEAKQLLSFTDVLISGLYVDKLNDNKGLRGSSNQKIHYLTSIFSANRKYFDNRKRDLEFHVANDGVLMAGIPERGFSW